MALTTATTFVPFWETAATRRATFLMRSAEATDVPPYFWTMRPRKESGFYRRELPVAVGIHGDPVEANFVVEVWSGADTAIATEGDHLSLAGALSTHHQRSGEVTVEGHQAGLVLHLDGVAVPG